MSISSLVAANRPAAIWHVQLLVCVSPLCFSLCEQHFHSSSEFSALAVSVPSKLCVTTLFYVWSYSVSDYSLVQTKTLHPHYFLFIWILRVAERLSAQAWRIAALYCRLTAERSLAAGGGTNCRYPLQLSIHRLKPRKAGNQELIFASLKIKQKFVAIFLKRNSYRSFTYIQQSKQNDRQMFDGGNWFRRFFRENLY